MFPCDLLEDTAYVCLESRLCSVHHSPSLAALDQGKVGVEHAEIEENVRIAHFVVRPSAFWRPDGERLFYESCFRQNSQWVLDTLTGCIGDFGVAREPASNSCKYSSISSGVGKLLSKNARSILQ
jgi:hypothetical protein